MHRHRVRLPNPYRLTPLLLHGGNREIAHCQQFAHALPAKDNSANDTIFSRDIVSLSLVYTRSKKVNERRALVVVVVVYAETRHCRRARVCVCKMQITPRIHL